MIHLLFTSSYLEIWGNIQISDLIIDMIRGNICTHFQQQCYKLQGHALSALSPVSGRAQQTDSEKMFTCVKRNIFLNTTQP